MKPKLNVSYMNKFNWASARYKYFTDRIIGTPEMNRELEITLNDFEENFLNVISDEDLLPIVMLRFTDLYDLVNSVYTQDETARNAWHDRISDIYRIL